MLIIAPDKVSGLWNRFMTEFDIMAEWDPFDADTSMVTHGNEP